MARFAAVPLPPLDEHSLLVFWCQVLVVLVSARLGGYVLRRLGQPRVIGELLAGVALGPSLFGEVWPTGFDWMFPPNERQAGLLLGLAWVGIVLLLATTGADVDLSTIRRYGRAMWTTTLGSLVLPIVLGTGVALLLPSSFIGFDGTRTVFAAFFAVAFAISSLPVAARILGDLGVLHTPFAQLSLGVATANDVIGWILLGVVVGIVEAGSFAIGPLLLASFVVVTAATVAIRFGARALDTVAEHVERRSGGPAAEVSMIVIAVVAFGTLTQAAGVEVVIGAFIAGIAVGGSRLRRGPGFASIEQVTNGVFAPLFFAVAGFRADLGELRSPSVIGWAVVVTVFASLAKIVGSYAGGRAGRLPPRDAFSLGCALNARGALEIVVATVGLSLGVINTTAYTVIVVMALATTAMTSPLLSLARTRAAAS